MKKLTANQIKDQLFRGKMVKANGWAINITGDDKVAIWPPKGDGFQTTLAYVDKAVKDFLKSAAGMPAPKVNTKVIPQGETSDPDMGEDSTEDVSWGKVKVNPRPKPQGKPANPDMGEDSTTDEGFKTPSINTRPQPPKGRGGLPNTDLGVDSSAQEGFRVPEVNTRPQPLSGRGEAPKKAGIVDVFSLPADREAAYRKALSRSPSASILEGIGDRDYWESKVAFASDDELSEIVDVICYNHPVDAHETLLALGLPQEVIQKALQQSKGHGVLEKDRMDLADAFGVEGEAGINDFSEHGGLSYMGASVKEAGPRLRENWGDGGAYSRDMEAESAEELHALVKAFGGEEVDWAAFKPVAPEATQDIMANKEAIDQKAKDYYTKYFKDKDYGKQLVKDILNRDRQIEKEEGSDKKEAQMAPAAPPQVAPRPTPAPGAPAAPGGAPTPKPAVPAPVPGAPAAPPGTGDDGLISLGWTQEDIQLMTQEEKEKVLQVQLNKPGTKQAPAAPGAAPPAGPMKTPVGPQQPGQNAPGPIPPPGPKTTGQPAEVSAAGCGKTSAMAERFNTLLKIRRAQQELMQPSAPVQNPVPAPTGAPPATLAPEGEPEFTEPQAQSDPYADMASTVFSVYSQIRAQKVNAASPEEVATQKAELFISTLLRDYGISVKDAVRLLGAPNSSPVSLFK